MTKIAAIWARVSSPGQTSLPDQVARAKAKLESEGYNVSPDRVLTVDWTSLDLFNCPEFLRLASWVRRGEIQAIGMLDRDRLHAEPSQRLAFLAECQEASVEWVICQGPPMLEGDWGGLIEHVYTITKKQQVLRAKLGAKDGMHDKVARDRKPTSKHSVSGYRWEGDLRLVPNEDWPTVKLILDMAVKGATYFDIQKELKKRVLPSPKGALVWDRSSIAGIVNNPIYAGRYYALKREVVTPKKRTGNSYGNTSARSIPLEDAVYLPEVEIVNPPITWEQYQQIQERHQRNRELAQRNAKNDYLLRGFVFCETHRGKKGQPRKYYGQPQNKTYGYTCPIGGCAHPNLNGPETEDWAKLSTWCLMNLQPDEFYEHIANRVSNGYTEESLNKEFRDLEVKYNKNITAETELERRSLLGQEHPEVYRQLKTRFQDERIRIEERKQAISEELAQLDYHVAAIAMLQEIRSKVTGRLLNELSQAEWRELFMALNLEIHVRDRNNPATWPETELENSEELPEMDIRWGLPLKAERVSDIVLNSPCPSPSS